MMEDVARDLAAFFKFLMWAVGVLAVLVVVLAVALVVVVVS